MKPADPVRTPLCACSRARTSPVRRLAVPCAGHERGRGPHNAAAGYKKTPVLSYGQTAPDYSGGTTQASSTLNNAMLQLPGVTVLQRRPHGPCGASCLPHGMDAAVGNHEQNLRLRNGYDLPLRNEAFSVGDGALTVYAYAGE